MAEIETAALCKGVKVPLSPYLTETRIRRMEEARYEGEEIAGALSVVRKGDRVLEMGAGLGVVGGVVAANAEPEAVLSFEANPDMIPHIEALYRLNGLEDRISVRNAVLVSGPDRPETMSFFLRNSFLGSSLIDTDTRNTREVRVPTADFAAVCEDFRPDVLILDIEGGELDLLRHADLAGIRAVVIELHPKAYGTDGARACKDVLRRHGFTKVDDVSTRFVWTCTRPDWAASRASTTPLPDRGWSRQVREVPDARVYPPVEPGLVTASGVMTQDGGDVAEAALWRGSRRLNLPPFTAAGPTERLEGRWLWGGVLWLYFAHFVTESLGRLWALDVVDRGALDGILFIPRRPDKRTDLTGFHKGVFDAFGVDLPVRVADRPLSVEQLVVPGQGFGLGEIAAGTPAMRAFARAHFGDRIAADGPEKLYISRARLGDGRGGLIGEAALEAHLEAEGYTVFHPERHDIATQIARYKAARQVLASEGSAVHLFAYAARPDQRVGIILRRKSGVTSSMAQHVAGFSGRAPVLIDALARSWQPKVSQRKRLAQGEPDMKALRAALIETGFLPDTTADWPALTAEAVAAELGDGFEAAEMLQPAE